MPKTPEKWEIWLAPFKYEDTEGVKHRPVLIYEEHDMYFLTLKITSHPPRESYDGEYVIVDWESAGLKKPSVIRCTKRENLLYSDLIRKLGRLSMFDIKQVAKVLKTLGKH